MVGKNAVSVAFLVNDKPIINVELLPEFNLLTDEAKKFLVSSIKAAVETVVHSGA